jgi:taurine dioxygenase
MFGVAGMPNPKGITIAPVTGALGAEIEGIDIGKPLHATTYHAIRQALLDHLVLFFRDQTMTPDQQIAFARNFGELETHQYTAGMPDHPDVIEIIKAADETHNWGDNWHTDLTGFPQPSMGSVLYAKEVPEFGGDTQFSNMYIAYETLSAGMKKLLTGLICIHETDARGYENFKSMQPLPGAPSRAEHPLVRTHPETGKKSLFLSRKKITTIKGMTPREARPLLDFLCDHAENPDFACRFRWKPGSVAFWDNRCTQHRVSADYFYELRGFPPSRRHLHRVSIRGETPV